MAVNYATGSQTNTSQFFAIESELAQEVVDELKSGDFESLGINGQAVLDEEAGIAGVWVSGVEPGSPVDEAGVLPGDIVTSLNGLPIGTDGTMKDYCDVIRTSAEGKPIEIEVLRYDTSEVLRGELYGDEPIQAVFSFAEEVGEVEDPTAATSTYSGYQSLVDDSGAITINVPNEWTVDRHGTARARRRHLAALDLGLARIWLPSARRTRCPACSSRPSWAPTATSRAALPCSPRLQVTAPPTTAWPTTTTVCSPVSTGTGRAVAVLPST